MKGQKKEGKEKEVGRKEGRKEEGRGWGDEQSKLYLYLEVGAISKQGPKPQRLRLEEQVVRERERKTLEASYESFPKISGLIST